MDSEIGATVQRVRARVAAKTLIQDLNEPLTGALDARRIAARFTNLENALGDLAEAVHALEVKIEQ